MLFRLLTYIQEKFIAKEEHQLKRVYNDSQSEIKKTLFVTKIKNKKNLISQGINDREGKFYIRMGVDDKPGVLADITLFFKKQKISIKSMFQLDNKIRNIVPLIFVTHKVSEKKIGLVLKKMRNFRGF